MKKIPALISLILSAYHTFAQPANDEPCNALVLPVIENADGCTPTVYNITGATFTNIPGTAVCSNNPDVWLRFNTPDPFMKIRFGGSNVTFTTYAYTSCSSNLQDLLVCIDSATWTTFGNNIAFTPNTNQLIRIESTNGSPNFSFSICLTLLRPAADQRIGVNTKLPQSNFDVAGKAVFRDTLSVSKVLRFNNGTQGANRVLTSDNNGYASWGNPPTNYWTTSGTNIYNNNTGNVGIGTSNPTNTYGLTGSIRSLEIQNPNTATDSRSALFLSTGALSGNVGTIQFGSPAVVTNNGTLGYISCVYETTGDNSNPSTSLIFSTRSPLTNPTRMIIKGNGNIGIGTSTPGFPLNFSNELGDKISFYGNSGNHYGFGIQSGLFQMHTDAVVADIAFGYGSSNNFSENMRIKGNGLVGIGTNNPTKQTEIIGAASATPVTLVIGNRGGFGPAAMEFVSDYGLVNQWRPGYIKSNDAGGFTGAIEFYTNGTGAGNLYGNIKGLEVRNGTTYTSTGTVSSWSDARLKTNIQPFTAGLDVINKINPVSFNYNNLSPFITDKKQIGILAQELEKVAPYMVDKTTTKDFEELRSVNNQAYIFLLINAVKEQQKQIEELKRMIKN